MTNSARIDVVIFPNFPNTRATTTAQRTGRIPNEIINVMASLKCLQGSSHLHLLNLLIITYPKLPNLFYTCYSISKLTELVGIFRVSELSELAEINYLDTFITM